MKPDIAVNLAEKIRLRGMRSRDPKTQQTLERLSWEVPSIRYEPGE
jgi:uncharacterized protein involved in exopolysaccharide biosynthesis